MGQMKYVSDWIQTGVDEGAKLVLDDRNPEVPEYESGLHVGSIILDQVTEILILGATNPG